MCGNERSPAITHDLGKNFGVSSFPQQSPALSALTTGDFMGCETVICRSD
ncbi:hypothetical protein ABIA96_007033 [Bradyrhizobium sp. LB11.1]